jgi:hypothetical protein
MWYLLCTLAGETNFTGNYKYHDSLENPMVTGKPGTGKADLSDEDREELERMMEEALNEKEPSIELVKDIHMSLREKRIDSFLVKEEREIGKAETENAGDEADDPEENEFLEDENEEDMIEEFTGDAQGEVEEERKEKEVVEQPPDSEEPGGTWNLDDVSENDEEEDEYHDILAGFEDASAVDDQTKFPGEQEKVSRTGPFLGELPECGDDALEMVRDYRQYERVLKAAEGRHPRIASRYESSQQSGHYLDRDDEKNLPEDGVPRGTHAGKKTNRSETRTPANDAGIGKGRRKDSKRKSWGRGATEKDIGPQSVEQEINGFLDSLNITDPIEANRKAYRARDREHQRWEEIRKRHMNAYAKPKKPHRRTHRSNPSSIVARNSAIAANFYILSAIWVLLLLLFGTNYVFGKSLLRMWLLQGEFPLAYDRGSWISLWLGIYLVYAITKGANDIRYQIEIKKNRDMGTFGALWLGLYVIPVILNWVVDVKFELWDLLPIFGLTFQLLGIIYLGKVEYYYHSFARGYRKMTPHWTQ